MAELKDSGSRREFDTGAVRDISEGKGRCDLLPLKEIGWFMGSIEGCPAKLPSILDHISKYIYYGNPVSIVCAIKEFIGDIGKDKDIFTIMLELSKHYEDGARKYSDRNWEKGIPLHCFIDSGVRHLFKNYRGDTDEPHDRAFLWNMFGLLWTLGNFDMELNPEIFDLPWCEKVETENNWKDRIVIGDCSIPYPNIKDDGKSFTKRYCSIPYSNIKTEEMEGK